MKFSDLKTTEEFTEYTLHSQPDWREVAKFIEHGWDDFEVDNVRFIKDSQIDKILAEELENDLYMLGCFNANFLACFISLPEKSIATLQDADQFEVIGELVADGCDMEDFASAYASADGYGHHFNQYDGGEEELNVNGVTYLVFDNH